MKTIFAFFASLIVAASAVPAQADVAIDFAQLQATTMTEASTFGLKWKVGDKAVYALTIGGFIKGTATNFVREDKGTEIWMQQDMDMGIMGKQKVEILFDKATGQIKKILANGQEQQIPSASDQEVVEMKEDKVRVIAGEFDCIYAKIKNTKDGSIQEAWINPQAVPMSGMLKALADSQFGKVTQELKSFQFAP